jgi:hypothetical protein
MSEEITIPIEPKYKEIADLRKEGLDLNWWPGFAGLDESWRVFKTLNLTAGEVAEQSFVISNGTELPCIGGFFVGRYQSHWVVDMADFSGPGRCRYFTNGEEFVQFVLALLFGDVNPNWEVRRN